MIVSYEEERKKNEKNETVVKPLIFDEEIFVWEQLEAIEEGYSKKRTIRKPAVLKEVENLNPSLDYGIETWSACKDGNGKGIIFHGTFPVYSDFFNNAKEQRKDVIRFSDVISGLCNDKNLHIGLELLTRISYEEAQKTKKWSRIAEKHRKNIERELKQYVNSSYMNLYLPEHAKIEDLFLSIDHRYNFEATTISRIEEIAEEYVDKLGSSYETLRAKEVCKKAIHVYFNKFKKESVNGS